MVPAPATVNVLPATEPGPLTTLKMMGFPEAPPVALRAMGAAPNVIGEAGGVKVIVCVICPTVTLAEAVPPVPPSVEEMVPVTLFCTPAVVPVTFTEIVQLLLSATVPPVRTTELPPAAAVGVPPQLLTSAFGVAITKPAGMVSVKLTPVNPELLGLVIVKVSDVELFSGIVEAPKALAMVGGLATTTLAEAVPPVPPLVDVTLPVVLFFVPAVVPVTLMEKVQLLLAETEAPVSATEPLPAVAVMVPPPQLPVRPLGVDMTRPAGMVSVKLTPVKSALELLFWMVKVRDVEPLRGMFPAPNALMMTGGVNTVRLAEAVPPAPPSVEVTLPVVLFLMPAVVPVTFTEKVQLLLPARVAPVSETSAEPAVAAIVPPPQLPVRPLGVVMLSPAGKLSVKPMPLKLVEALLF